MAFEDRSYYRDGGFSGGGVCFGFPPFTPLTLVIMGICLAAFIAQAVSGSAAGSSPLIRYGWLSFDQAEAFKEPWRWVTYQYIHGGGLHLFFNMLVLYFFLPQLERRWGWLGAWGFYTAGGIVAGVTFGLMSAAMSSLNPLIGASGSVMAILGACAFLFPEQRVLFFFFPVPIRILTGLLAVLYLLTVLGDRSLSDAAHLGGLAFGFFAPWLAGPMFGTILQKIKQRRQRMDKEADQEIEREVDRILQKVHGAGMGSLSRRERNWLRQATQRQRDHDNSRTRKGP